MSDILIEAGRRVGPGSLSNDAEIRSAIEAGNRVFMKRNGVYFAASLVGDRLVYTALAMKPVGL